MKKQPSFKPRATVDQMESEFRRQVRLCQGIGKRKMLEIVTAAFVIWDSLEGQPTESTTRRAGPCVEDSSDQEVCR